MMVVIGKPGKVRKTWLLKELVKKCNPLRNKQNKITFEKQPFGDQLGKVQTVQGQDVVQHDAPEVESIEDGSDPAGRCF